MRVGSVGAGRQCTPPMKSAEQSGVGRGAAADSTAPVSGADQGSEGAGRGQAGGAGHAEASAANTAGGPPRRTRTQDVCQW